MAGRGNGALANALQALAQAMQNQPNAIVNNGTRALETFQRNHPPMFKGNHDPEGAHEWLKDIERFFRLMHCSNAQEMCFGTHMLA